MRRITWIIVVVLTWGSLAVQAETVDLFIMAGQSNMQGWAGDAAFYPADPQQLDRHIRFFWEAPTIGSSLGLWTFLSPQAGLFPSGHFGPEVSFARALATHGHNPAIFKFSLGGTSLAADWGKPGENGLYDQMASAYKEALILLTMNGIVVEPRAFVWIQGESDAKTPELAGQYFDRLCLLVDDVRKNMTGVPQLPVILGVDEQHPWVQEHPTVVEAQQKFAQSDGHAIWTSMLGLEKADVTHLTPAGLDQHGKRLFDAFMILTRGSAVNVKPTPWGKIKQMFQGSAKAPSKTEILRR